ncbi:hypothetical protein [Sorangium cellulosum]|uniref:hypothetical protein n=2 Tax=Sorangium TaxID=39643 RepID=UPI0010131F43|nr:hypothetical protein [Sorangium cellulosum]
MESWPSAPLAHGPVWKPRSAERAAADISDPIVIVVLSAGGDLRRDLGHRRGRGFRHPVMHHFLRRELVPLPLAVPGLASGMEAASAKPGPIGGAGAAERLTTPERAAVEAEALAAIAATAEAKLDAAAGAEGEAVGGRRQRAPCRRFLDLEPGL